MELSAFTFSVRIIQMPMNERTHTCRSIRYTLASWSVSREHSRRLTTTKRSPLPPLDDLTAEGVIRKDHIAVERRTGLGTRCLALHPRLDGAAFVCVAVGDDDGVDHDLLCDRTHELIRRLASIEKTHQQDRRDRLRQLLLPPSS